MRGPLAPRGPAGAARALAATSAPDAVTAVPTIFAIPPATRNPAHAELDDASTLTPYAAEGEKHPFEPPTSLMAARSRLHDRGLVGLRDGGWRNSAVGARAGSLRSNAPRSGRARRCGRSLGRPARGPTQDSRKTSKGATGGESSPEGLSISWLETIGFFSRFVNHRPRAVGKHFVGFAFQPSGWRIFLG